MEKDLNLIIGRAGTGKTNEILERVREDIKRDENVYLIVPEQFSYTFEKKITDFFSSVLNVQIVSFSRLVDQILNDSKFKNKVYIDDISRNIILENVLGKLDLKILKNKEKNIDAISNMIEEFKKYNINIENLNSYILEEKQKGINHSILKLEEIYNIYVEYNKEIEEKYLDIADKENEVLNIIEKENSFAGYKIYIDQFYKFTYGEYNLIEKMLKQADEVNLAITADSIHKKSDYEVFSTTKNTISQIIQIAQTNNISTNIITKDKNLKHDEEIQNFEKALFEENSINENITKEDNIKLRVYKNIEDELEDLAENIMQEIIEKKYNYSDIAVVYNDLENQENLIRRIFDKYNIPIIIDSEKKLEQNSMARYILDLLEILYSNYSISSVFSFLKLGYSNFDLEDIYLLEKYVLRWRVRGSKWKSEWKNYDKLNDEDFNGIIKVKEEFVQFIEGIKTKLTKSKTSKDISLLIYNLIEEQDIFNKAINNINDLKISDNQKLELLNEYTVSLNLLRESLDRIVSIKQDDIISYEKYYDIFKIILRETSIKQIPSVNDSIHFITSKTLNMEDIKSLYIIALEDGLYPMLPSYKGIINDEEKLILRANNINLSETDIERLADDDFNMYSIFMIPSTSIYMSYHISTLKGDSKRVSIYVNKIKRKLKYLEEETRIKGLYKEVPRIYSEKALLEKVLSKYLEYLEGKKIEDEWKYLIYILQNSSDEFVLIEKNILNKNIAPNISMEILEKIFRQDLHTSVSRLEEYAKCPFAYFARYTLNLQEEKKYELNPLNTGTLLHDVLQEFVDQIKDKKISLDAINSKLLFIQDNEILKLKKGNEEYNKDFNETMEEIDKITDDIINKKLEEDKYKIFKFSPKFEFLTEKFREEIKKATKVVLNTLRLSDFEVLGNEININADFKKSKYPLANNRFTQIYGQIDRADIYKRGDDTYLRIVDYKSSANHLDENKIKAGLQLQLLTYMDVLAKEKEYLPSATLYFGLETPIKNLSKKDLKEIEKAEEINYKMTGLVLADEEIVRAMDKSLETGNSDILPVGFKKDGDFRADSRIKDANEFEELRKIVSKNIISMSENILQGDISIYPYKYKDETGCKYCPYKSICQFNIKKNRYRRINK